MASATSTPTSGGTTIEAPERRRTVLIWVIFAWTCYALLSAVVTLALTGAGIMPQGQGVGPWSQAVGLVAACVQFAAGLALFNLRARALWLFVATLVIAVAQAAYWQIVGTDALIPRGYEGVDEALKGGIRYGVWFSAGFGFVIYGLMIWYTVRLRRRGILR